MILDATAGNRTMWRYPNSENIIYIDIEKRLEVKPTIFCDNTRMPFKDKQFDTIFFDPPHSWYEGDYYYTFPDRASLKAVYPTARESPPRYYGWDKIKNKSHLLKYLFNAQKELRRVLKDDGLLWLKWNEMKIPLATVLIIMQEWNELLRIYVKSPTQTGMQQTYWICLEKKLGAGRQLTLP